MAYAKSRGSRNKSCDNMHCFSNGRWWSFWNAKVEKIKMASCKEHPDTSWYNKLRFSQSQMLLFLIIQVILTGLFICNFKTTPDKNHFDTNSV